MAISGGKFPSLKTCIDGIIQVDVKHIGSQEVEASTSQHRGALGDDDVRIRVCWRNPLTQ